jgi:hypothetical protein
MRYYQYLRSHTTVNISWNENQKIRFKSTDDEHMAAVLCNATSKFTPNIGKLVNNSKAAPSVT